MDKLIVCHENKPLGSFQLESLGLVVSGTPSLSEWESAGRALKKASGAVQWWIGDWLNYGERAYGEMYAQALDATEYDYQTLRVQKYVANRVQLLTRSNNLSWKHHRIVAPLEPEQQIEWLQRAEQGDGNGKPWSVATLQAAIAEAKTGGYPTWLRFTDVWNFTACDDRFGLDWPGRIPGQIVLNVLHYFTDEGDLVIDPMAGGGVTLDACRELRRRCLSFDVTPSRFEIVLHDATQPWPASELARLVFIDPPYWSQMADDYGGMALDAYDSYLEQMGSVFQHAMANLRSDGSLAILIAPMAIKTEYTDIPVDFINICHDLGFRLVRRISVPVGSQQIGPSVMEHCREQGIMAALLRDLLVFAK
jgi:hypothetical protein